ncbi:biotin-dependent carboxyltransferase family protein [Hyphomonas sp.]|uniref:5-oxoprolinase subunit C family protein n=1 Tax=Hyphomonas sp. TaxID=87 RepID=UPI003241C854
MSFVVTKPGLQVTLQAAPRHGLRHMGVPASGPADPLSMALANRLVGNPPDACSLEIPFGMFSFAAQADAKIAMTGAPVTVRINGEAKPMHQNLSVRAGDAIELGSAEAGARVYLAVAGGFTGTTFLGSESTYLPAAFGGYEGRALKSGDILAVSASDIDPGHLETPEHMRQVFSRGFALRCVPGPDESLIAGWDKKQDFVASRRADRTGIEVTGSWPCLQKSALRPSAPIFPGGIQLTPSGAAFILLQDAQTTGGYPHVLQITHADHHLLGQIRPGDRIQFLKRTPEEASDDLREKVALFRSWIPDLRL